MRGTLLLAAAGLAMLTGTPRCVAEDFTAEQNLLGGFTHFDTFRDYPATLTLPPGWSVALKRLSATTLETGHEVGACLQLTAAAEGEQQRERAMAQYTALMAKRSSLAADQFAAQEAALRQQIEAPATDTAGAQSEWTIGAVQGGAQWSVDIEANGVQCSGENLGTVHTHPPDSYGVHSDSDLRSMMANNQRLTVVVYKEQACLLIRDNSVITDGAAMNWEVTSTYLANPSANGIPGMKKRMREIIAALIEPYQGAYYCGDIDGPLKKVSPAAQNPNAPQLIMASKGLLIMLKNDDPARAYTLDFPFTPVLDDRFMQTAARLLGRSVADIRPWSAKHLFERLAATLAGAADVAYSDGFAFPDPRDNPAGPHRSFVCMPEKNLTCSVDRTLTVGHTVTEASYDAAHGTSSIAQLQHAGGQSYAIQATDTALKMALSGQGSIVGDELIVRGPGTLQGDGFELKGTFLDWTPQGQVQYRKTGETQWRSGVFENGHLRQTAGQ